MKGFFTQDEIANGVSNGTYCSENTQSILEKYPEYGFKPTSLHNKRASGRKWLLALYIFLGIIGGVYLISGVVALFVYIIIGLEEDQADSIGGITSLVLFIAVYMPLFLAKIILWYRKGILSSLFADYIQTKGKMRFFVKDGKFGLVKVSNYKILVPANYDKLTWNQRYETIMATLNGTSFLIDVHNNRLK